MTAPTGPDSGRIRIDLLASAAQQEADRFRKLIDTLLQTYRPEGVHIWLGSRNRWLHDERPIDLCAAGLWEAVQECADRIEEGL